MGTRSFFICGNTEFTRKQVIEGDDCILNCPINKEVDNKVLGQIAIDVEVAMKPYYEYEELGVWDKARLQKKRLQLIEDIAHTKYKCLADEIYT